MSLFKMITPLEEKNNYSLYLAVFRVFICFHLAKDIFLSWPYLGILYGPGSFLAPVPTFVSELLRIDSNVIREHYQLFIAFYLVVIVLYLFGIGKHLTALVLFLLHQTLQRLCPLILNGGDNLLTFIILYMIFANSYEYFSIRSLQWRKAILRRTSNLLSNLAVLAIVLHLCMAYFWSAVHKIHADVWFNGVATYYTFNLERFRGTPFNHWLAQNGYFVTLSTYATVGYELFFPVLIWFRQTRLLMIFGGLLLHLGIYVFMMIYDFEIVFIMTYGFFFADETWLRVINKVIGWINGRFRRNIPLLQAA